MKSLLVSYFLFHFGLGSAPVPQEEAVAPERTEDALQVEFSAAPVGSTTPGALRVPVLDVRLTAPCTHEVSVHALEVLHRGLGDVQDITGVYSLEGFRRLQRAYTFRRDGVVHLRFRNVTIPACSTRHLMVAVDFSVDAAPVGQHVFSLQGVQSSSEVFLSESIPEHGRTLSVAAGRETGEISIEYLPLHNTVHFGDNQRIARYLVRNDGTQAQAIHAITLYNEGTAAGDEVQQLRLESNTGKRLTNIAPQLTGRHVRLQFNPPLTLQRNERRQFLLRATINAGRSATLQFVVEEPSDLETGSFFSR